MTAAIGKGKVGRPPKLKPKVILPNAGYPLHMKIEQLRNAIKNVAMGEELTLDYATFLDENMQPFECHCGASNCRKWIEINPIF